jgi:ammonia channel protein AmtB
MTTSTCCCFAFKIKAIIGIDDSLDAFGLHGVGGFLGSLMTGIFAQKWLGELDGSYSPGGIIEGNPIQFAYQLLAALVIATYSFAGTLAILFCLQKIPGISLRLTIDEQALGGDFVEMGEAAYEYLHVDYTPTFPSEMIKKPVNRPQKHSSKGILVNDIYASNEIFISPMKEVCVVQV